MYRKLLCASDLKLTLLIKGTDQSERREGKGWLFDEL